MKTISNEKEKKSNKKQKNENQIANNDNELYTIERKNISLIEMSL